MEKQKAITELVREHRGFLTPRQVEEYKTRIANTENWLKNHRYSPYKRERDLDETHARRQLKKYVEMLNKRQAPDIVKDNDRAKLAARAKFLENKIKEGMPTKDEMMGERHSRSDNPNSKYQIAKSEIVDKHLAWQERTARYQEEWKKIIRVLEPNDPNSSNIERLRKIH